MGMTTLFHHGAQILVTLYTLDTLYGEIIHHMENSDMQKVTATQLDIAIVHRLCARSCMPTHCLHVHRFTSYCWRRISSENSEMDIKQMQKS